jgi:hypothetical protein
MKEKLALAAAAAMAQRNESWPSLAAGAGV